MKKVVLVGVSAFCLLTACRKENSDSQSPKNAKSLSKITSDDGNSQEFYYDNSNKLKGIVANSSLGNYDSTFLHYDADKISFSISTPYLGTYSCKHDKSGKVVKIIWELLPNNYDSLEYDNTGNIVVYTRYVGNNDIYLKRFFKWDKNGNLTEDRCQAGPDFRYGWKWIYTYNSSINPVFEKAPVTFWLFVDLCLVSKNNIATETFEATYKNGSVNWTSVYSYTYDADGYPTKSTSTLTKFIDGQKEVPKTENLTFQYR